MTNLEQAFQMAVEKNAPDKFYRELRKLLLSRFKKVPKTSDIKAACLGHGRITVEDDRIGPLSIWFAIPPRFLDTAGTERIPRGQSFNGHIATEMHFSVWFCAKVDALFPKRTVKRMREWQRKINARPA